MANPVIDLRALRTIEHYRSYLTRQQFKTLRGQVLAGDADGAMRGLQRIFERK